MVIWNLIKTAPHNRRLIVYGIHDEGGHDETAMAWWDIMDDRWYYAPQGGLLSDHGWQPTHWQDIHEGPTL